MIPAPRWPRLTAVAGALAAFGLLVGGCQAAPVKPRTAVTCSPGEIVIEVTNVSTKPARYTVSVEIERAGEVETEQYSSDRIEPGASATITDSRPDEQEKCSVSGVQVWDA